MLLDKQIGTGLMLALAVFAFSVFPVGDSVALDKPSGPVVLTITGAIAETNRGAFDELEDGFFKFHDQTFKRASAFDIAMLEALGSVSVSINFHKWPETVRLEGPRLTDLLKAVGAAKGNVLALALDGYTVEITPEELATENWVVAIKRNGKYLGIGDRGPVWLVYDPPNGAPATDDDEARWPWAVFVININ